MTWAERWKFWRCLGLQLLAAAAILGRGPSEVEIVWLVLLVGSTWMVYLGCEWIES